MKLTAAFSDGNQTSLSFDRPEGRLNIRCVQHPGQVPSCDLSIGDTTPIAVGLEEQAAVERLLAEWVAEHIPAHLIEAFETPGMHIRMTGEGTQQYLVWSVLDDLLNRHRAQPERWTKFGASFGRTKA
jgi:hypothetical protein